MPRRAFVLPILVLGLALAACEGDKDTAPTATKEPFIDVTPQPFPTSDPSLEEALLTAADLGEGWVEQPPTDATVAETYYCGVKLPLGPSAAAVAFVHPDRPALALEGFSVFADDADAAAAAQAFADAHVDCDVYISTDGDRRTEYNIEEFRELDLGDEAYFEHSSSESFGGPPAQVQGVLLRKGSVIITVGVVYVEEPDSGEVLEIARRALAKYEGASR